MDTPAPKQGTLVAFIYDGMHDGISHLAQDAQTCEYYAASDGTWHRCRPIVPSSNSSSDDTTSNSLQVSYEQMMKATDVVTSRLEAFCLGIHGAVEHHSPLSHKHKTTQFSRSASLARVSEFVNDRHGHQTPTHHGTHH